MEEKHADLLWKVTLTLLIIALLGYGGLFIHSRLHPKRQTVVATDYTYQDSVEVTGILVRSESLLSDARPSALVTAHAGKRVAAGEVLGISYESAEDMERHRRMDSLRQEIALGVQALGGAEKERTTAERLDDTRSAVLSLSACIARHNVADLRYYALRLRSLIFDNGTLLTREEIAEAKAELAALESQPDGGSRELVSPASGIFTPLLDGCESISPAVLENLSVKSLRTLMAGHPSVDKRCYGKLITDYKWYYAAFVQSGDCASLRPGDTVALDLSAWRAGLCSVRIETVSPESEGVRAVLFSSDEHLSETLELRTVSCPLVRRSVSGIRLPKKALEQNGSEVFVRVDTGISERLESVTVLHEEADWVLVEGVDAGDTVIVQ